jgi:mannose-6-phosphate isomerase-like protein (cupin superfamily)
VWFNGGLVKFYALGEDTGGAFTLFEEAIAPQDRAMPHLHHEEDQAFYVLEGEHEFFCDGRTFTAGTGSFVYVPRGTTHSYENVGTEPGRLLILSTPAGGTERLSPTASSKSDRCSARSLHGSRARTVALRGASVSRAASPNREPGPSVARLRSWLSPSCASTSARPSRSR